MFDQNGASLAESVIHLKTAYVTMSALLLERLNKKSYMSEKHLKFKSNFIPGYTIRSCTILRVFL